jgi:Flp pilus assembly protein TadG
MRTTLNRLQHCIRQFGRSTRAVAAVEFALILPALLTLYLGSVELSSAISVDKRVATVSGSLGDLVARADGEITTATINDYFRASAATMAPYSSANVRQVVTCVFVDSDGNATVSWSVPSNGATAHTPGSAYDLSSDTNLRDLALDSYIIVAESSESYSPLIGYFFDTAFNLYHRFYFFPRFGEEIVLDPP